MSLQVKWQHLSRAEPNAKAHLQPIEDTCREKCTPGLGVLKPKELENDTQQLFANSMKQIELNLRDPSAAVPRHKQSSLEGSDVLVKLLMEGQKLDSMERKEVSAPAKLASRRGRRRSCLRIQWSSISWLKLLSASRSGCSRLRR